MEKIPTGQDLIIFFQKECDEQGKLFVPDPPRQEQVAKSLVEHFIYEELELAVNKFVSDTYGAVLVFDFAIKSRDLIERSKFETQSKKRFKEIVEQTRLKMESN
mgnify:FL=1